MFTTLLEYRKLNQVRKVRKRQSNVKDDIAQTVS